MGTPRETYVKILDWKQSLVFPPEVPISEKASRTILRFCDDMKTRVTSLPDIQSLGWFQGVDWLHIRERPAAIGVDLKIPVTANTTTGLPYKDWVFLNYTFKRFEGL